jgi:hypothetical protein
VGACICFIISAGDLDALTEEFGPRTDTAARPSTTTTTAQATQDANLDNAQDRLSELANASLRAVTSLYAGTDPEAGKLNGKVRYPRVSEMAPGIVPAHRCVSFFSQVSHRLGSGHTST